MCVQIAWPSHVVIATRTMAMSGQKTFLHEATQACLCRMATVTVQHELVHVRELMVCACRVHTQICMNMFVFVTILQTIMTHSLCPNMHGRSYSHAQEAFAVKNTRVAYYVCMQFVGAPRSTHKPLFPHVLRSIYTTLIRILAILRLDTNMFDRSYMSRSFTQLAMKCVMPAEC